MKEYYTYLFRIPYSVFHIPYSIFHIPYSVFHIPYSVFRALKIAISIKYFLLCFILCTFKNFRLTMHSQSNQGLTFVRILLVIRNTQIEQSYFLGALLKLCISTVASFGQATLLFFCSWMEDVLHSKEWSTTKLNFLN